MGLTVVLAAALPIVVGRANSERLLSAVCWVFAAGLIANELFRCGYVVANKGWDTFVREYLPLHFCGLATYLTAIALVSRKQLVYEVAYFWGLAGAAMAMITPAIQEDFPSFQFITFFVGHGGIVVGVCFATFALGLRPRLFGLWITVALSICLACLVGAINYVLDSNYMFVCGPPVSASPLFFLPWPWYMPFISLVAIVLFLLLWLPWGVWQRPRGE
jgi:hypothetical integral membrane protein (TIGR02206 family)